MEIKKIRIKPPEKPDMKWRQKQRLAKMLREAAMHTGHVEASPDVYACLWFILHDTMKGCPPLNFAGSINGTFFKAWKTDTGDRTYILQPMDPEWIHEKKPERSTSDALTREADANKAMRDGKQVFGRKGYF